jgi:ABC-type polysaccharide/polyol phosphate transport system ATPase subunit
MSGATKPGEIRAVGLGRRFELRTGGPRSVKDVILRRSRTDRHEFWALRNIDLKISPGETFGLVGRNGSGKSTLLNLIARIYAPTEGTLEIGGRTGALLEVGAGFHPEFTGTENVYLSGAIHGLSRRYIDAHLEEIIGFAELERFAHMPVRTYSSGMILRLGFSVAVHVRPEVLLIDEVLAVGDAAFQQKCFAKIWEFKRTGGSIVFVSHDATTVSSLCDRAALLEDGRIAALGKADEVLRTYQQSVIQGTPVGAGLESDGVPRGRYEIEDVRATADDGSRRDRFAENERITIQAHVFSAEVLVNGCVSMTLRDLSGRVLGSETLRGVRLEAGKTESISWILDQAPLREGRFLVDVRLATERSDAELVAREAAVDFSIVSDSSDDDGPVKLGGEWQLAGRIVPRPRTATLGLRVAIVGSPRCGNTWLRRLLATLYNLTETAAHTPSEVDWERLPPRCALQLLWQPTEPFRAELAKHGFRVLTLARHPFDVLLSILHFAENVPETARWLDGQGGDETGIRGADPCSSAFRTYALGTRAKALLSISPAWWKTGGTTCLHYEDLVRDPSAELEEIRALISVPPARSVEDSVQLNTLERLRATSWNQHYWRGEPGIWRGVLPARAAAEMAQAHRRCFAILGYDVDADPNLTVHQAQLNWRKLIEPEAAPPRQVSTLYE